MRPHTIDIDVVDESTTEIAPGLTGAGPWVSTDFTRTAARDSLAHQLSLTSAAIISAISLTVVGTNPDGDALSEAITGPNIATVESTGYFATVTSITASATLGANTMDVGVVDEVASYTFPIDWRSPYACNIAVDVTGTINFTVQQTFVNVLDGTAPIWTNISALASKTADTDSSASVGATAIRVITSSYSSGAELQVYSSQATAPGC